MKKRILSTLVLAFGLLFVSSSLYAAGGSNIPLDSADIDLSNKESLQRGLKYYVSYCLSCHSANYSRYNRVARDLGITDAQMVENIIFTRDEREEMDKVGSLMKIAMRPLYGREAFGTHPPDLTVISRSHGADWLYTYLRSFYVDSSRPFGANNTTFPGVGMPHVLWELQGWQEKKEVFDEKGHSVGTELIIVRPGSESPAEFDQTVRDIVNFLVYLGEPAQEVRKQIGLYVLLFLFILFIPAYYLKKEYWKDIH